MNDQCTSITEDKCAGKVALVSAVTFNLGLDASSVERPDENEDVDSSAAGVAIKAGLADALEADFGSDITIVILDITFVSNRRRLQDAQPSSILVDYRVEVPVTEDMDTAAITAAKESASTAVGTDLAVDLPALGGGTVEVPRGTAQSQPFKTYTFARTAGVCAAVCSQACGAEAVIVSDVYTCMEDGVAKDSSVCEPKLGATPTTETVCCAATSACPNEDQVIDEEEEDSNDLAAKLDELDPIVLMAATAGGMGVLCLVAICIVRLTCCSGGKPEYDEEDGSDSSYDTRTAVDWKEAGTPNTSVDFTVSVQSHPAAEKQEEADSDEEQISPEEGLPPEAVQDDGTALEKAKRLKMLLEQVHSGQDEAEEQQAAGPAGDEEDALAEVDAEHLHAVGDKAERSWGKLRADPASQVAWDMASAGQTASAEESKAALVTSWMRHGAESPPPRAGPAAAPSTPSSPKSTVEATFGDGPLGIKFGKQRVKPGGGAPEWQAVCVAKLLPGQQAARIAGLKPGMAILSVNGKDVKGLPTREVMHALTHCTPPRPVDVTFGWPSDPVAP
jgi:hypothetical protein